MKLPLFWANNIISWFAMAEEQFVLHNINPLLQRFHRPASSE
jgi:hypothetical protein